MNNEKDRVNTQLDATIVDIIEDTLNQDTLKPPPNRVELYRKAILAIPELAKLLELWKKAGYDFDNLAVIKRLGKAKPILCDEEEQK